MYMKRVVGIPRRRMTNQTGGWSFPIEMVVMIQSKPRTAIETRMPKGT